jgi:hypothetical protein
MNASEWWMCGAPEGILAWLGRSSDDRCLRLFCCACCRLIWPLITDPSSRKAVEVSERFADGLADSFKLRSAATAVRGLHCSGAGGWLGAWAAAEAAGDDARVASAWVPAWAAEAAGEAAARSALIADESAHADAIAAGVWQQQRQFQCGVLRDIFVNPFKPAPALEPGWLRWRDGAVVQAVQASYERGDCEDLTHLARLLEQAGCANEEILAHCRASSRHVRGCWVLDLLLRKRDLPGREQGLLRFAQGARAATREAFVPRYSMRRPPASARLACG